LERSNPQKWVRFGRRKVHAKDKTTVREFDQCFETLTNQVVIDVFAVDCQLHFQLPRQNQFEKGHLFDEISVSQIDPSATKSIVDRVRIFDL
jgi:hypothetical protein